MLKFVKVPRISIDLKPRSRKVYTKATSKVDQNLRVSSLATDALADTNLSAAAALIAEFEAPTYNETLPDLGPEFPKI
ncbi:hypothetical protein TWF506_004504 [Arthrobotrys conoides]|uniref:Uncharacterized protein n=1 Tax=Arthrobotrys conoides TaxID=74498 RepID=A0AAN8RIE0_9PEZI